VTISKTAGNAVDPVEVVRRFGTDALRWWLAREVARDADVDFTEHRLVARVDRELANGLGNLVHRIVPAHRHGGRVGRAVDRQPQGRFGGARACR
jgi:methionyl-tRNA synthetase